MKKNLFKTLLTASVTFVPVSSCMLTAISCSQKYAVESFELHPELDNIRPGENKLIRAVAMPDYHRITDLSWRLIDCEYSEIWIDTSGRVFVDATLSVYDPIELTIEATLISNHQISNTTKITVLPKPFDDFQGFKNNEIQFVNYEGNIDSVQLTQTDDKTYVTSRNIDIFEGDMSPAPSGWTSHINFEALVGGENPNFMSFTLDGGAYKRHTIQWGDDYNDSSWTSSIPWFDTVHNTYIFDKIIVRFSCDADVRLIINLTAWQKPEQDAPAIYSYIPSIDDGEPNPISFVEQGIYKLKIPCPGTARQGIITKTIDSVYAYRHKFFYSDFTFKWEDQKDLDPDIKNMFVYFQQSQPLLVERPFDALRSYKITLSYQIDLSARQYTYEHWDYNDIQLGTIYANDPMTGDAANLEVWLVWED